MILKACHLSELSAVHVTYFKNLMEIKSFWRATEIRRNLFTFYFPDAVIQVALDLQQFHLVTHGHVIQTPRRRFWRKTGGDLV